ncbi:hypothetical protein NQZ68_038758, partial [Dissostichus eleginoides]
MDSVSLELIYYTCTCYCICTRYYTSTCSKPSPASTCAYYCACFSPSSSPSPAPYTCSSPSPAPYTCSSPSPAPCNCSSPSPAPCTFSSPSPTPYTCSSPSPTPYTCSSPSPTPYTCSSPSPAPSAAEDTPPAAAPTTIQSLPPPEAAPPPAPEPAPQNPEPDRRPTTPGGTKKEVKWEDLQNKATNGEANDLEPKVKDSLSRDISDVSAISSISPSVESEAGSEGPQEAAGASEGGASMKKSESMEETEDEEEPEPPKPPPPPVKAPGAGGEVCSLGRNNDDDDDDKKKRSGIGAKMMGLVGLGKKQNSQINPEEEEKKKKVIRLPVQRSVETGLAVEFKGRFTRQPSRDPDADDPKPGALIFPGVKLAADKHFSGFLENLGPAQLAGRQTLATPPMGDIQIGMVYRKERLDVEVIRARGLVGKQGTKNNTPAPYVKVYLMDNGKCVMKRRTRLARKSPDPLYQQQLQFEESPEGKVLQ